MRSKFPEGARVGLLMLDGACWSQWDVRSMPELGTPGDRADGTCRAPLVLEVVFGSFLRQCSDWLRLQFYIRDNGSFCVLQTLFTMNATILS